VNELAKQSSIDTADKLIREALRSMN